MIDLKALDNYFEEKLLHLHTAFLAKVIKAESPNCIDVQPLTLTKQIGGEPKKQALLTKLSCLSNVWSSIAVDSVVLCVVCERDITQARKGLNAVPSLGRHEMKNSIIIGTICTDD